MHDVDFSSDTKVQENKISSNEDLDYVQPMKQIFIVTISNIYEEKAEHDVAAMLLEIWREFAYDSYVFSK